MTFRRLVSGLCALALAVLVVAAPVSADAAKAPAGKVNINTASAEQLASVPGVGPKLAARIVEHRQKSGAFKAVEDILAVKGIGEKSFAKMQPHFTLGDAPRPAAAR
jgi:competence protein ComEA